MDRLTKQTKRTRSTQRDQGETQNVAEEDIAQSCQDPSLPQQQDTLKAVGRKRRQRADAPSKHEPPNVLGERVLGGKDPQHPAGIAARRRLSANLIAINGGVGTTAPAGHVPFRSTHPWPHAASSQASTAAVTRARASRTPSASPFSKSPSSTAIWFVTWAKQTTGRSRTSANA